MMAFLLTSHSVALSFSGLQTLPLRLTPLPSARCTCNIMQTHSDWAENLITELEGAADLAQRGGAISDVLRKAKQAAAAGAQAAREADEEMNARLKAAEERAAKALKERDVANARATAAEASITRASEALEESKRQLAEAESTLDRYKKAAAEEMGRLDDAFEFEQDRVRNLQKALEEQKRALKEAQTESKLANAREATASAEAAASKREKSEVELRLEEERQLLEGCLVDARSERDALLCRALVAESKIGRKRRAVRNLVSASAERIRKIPNQLRSLTWSGRNDNDSTRSRSNAGRATTSATGS